MLRTEKKTQRHAISVWVTEEEKEMLKCFSLQTRNSLSQYMRSLALGKKPISKIDKDLFLGLRKLSADMQIIKEAFVEKNMKDTQHILSTLSMNLLEIETFTDKLKEELKR